MGVVLFVRVKTNLDPEELERRSLERRPRFREVPGLVQKIYGRDEATGDVCGVYFFVNREALAAFGKTELAQTIADAYEAVEVRREVYDVLYPLHPDRGPSAERNGRSHDTDPSPTYYDLVIEAEDPETEIWLADLDGHLVQKEVGTLSTGLLAGNYTVEFGLGAPQYEIALRGNTRCTETELTAGEPVPRRVPKMLDED